ncbi:MAG TPA: 1-deoxy-D-xylulose-5-phosphate reductoisomerase [Acidimicrobiales bacterium]|jgi:1-deoxy-D-xylulose-5-phosphate reductoisomerase|nr:1-deoxy-D-xylulose-5-phosphate reductoisomerase [Acidimicrobiales bacterium]
MSRAVSIVGSTGSIGTQTIDVVRRRPEAFRVAAIGANRSVELLIAQARELEVDVVAIADATCGPALKAALPGRDVRAGAGALESIATVGEIVVNGVVGFAGLDVTVAALGSGRRLALANKESLIAGAPVVQRARATPGAEIVPVDSEHCAIHQCLGERRHTCAGDLGAFGGPTPPADVNRLIVTASGGPFRGRTASQLASVSIEDALEHPTWKMGPKITIDSSTLMNKGLEVIEAHELFGIGYDEIEVVVHPQSIVHSMVEFCDGATIAQLSNPDMRLPIGYALAYPSRFEIAFGALDWGSLATLDFAAPDTETFRCLALAYAAGRAGGSAPATLSAANEIAVDAFLNGRVGWLDIATVVEETLDAHSAVQLGSVEDVLNADADARRLATDLIARRERAA